MLSVSTPVLMDKGVDVRDSNLGEDVVTSGDVRMIGNPVVSGACRQDRMGELNFRSVSSFATTDSRNLSFTSEVILKNNECT